MEKKQNQAVEKVEKIADGDNVQTVKKTAVKKQSATKSKKPTAKKAVKKTNENNC